MRRKSIVFILLLIIIGGFVYFKEFYKQDIESVKDSVVKIEVYDKDDEYIASGSGFCLYKSNYIVTNYHVIEEGYKFKIISDDEKEYEANRVVACNDNYDIAILSGNFNFKPIKLGSSDNLKSGDDLTVIGSPKGVLNIVSTGIISNANDDYNFNLTAPISPGSSGGVVLNKKNEAIGVVRATYEDAQNLNYAIRIQYIKDMYNVIEKNEVVQVNEENFKKLYVNLKDFDRYTRFYKQNYYGFENLEIFYKLTDSKEVFEYLLSTQDLKWYKKYSELSSKKRDEIIDDIISYSDDYPADYEMDVSNISDWKVKDLFIGTRFIDDYKFLILSAQLRGIEDKKEESEIINGDDIEDEGLKYMLLKYLGTYEFKDFTSEQREKISQFVQSKIEDKNQAKKILELMNFSVKIKEDKTLEVTWKE